MLPRNNGVPEQYVNIDEGAAALRLLLIMAFLQRARGGPPIEIVLLDMAGMGLEDEEDEMAAAVEASLAHPHPQHLTEKQIEEKIKRNVLPAFRSEIESDMGSFRGDLNNESPEMQLKIIQYLLLKEGKDKKFESDVDCEVLIQKLDEELELFSDVQAAANKAAQTEVELKDDHKKQIHEVIMTSLLQVETVLIVKKHIRNWLISFWRAVESSDDKADLGKIEAFLNKKYCSSERLEPNQSLIAMIGKYDEKGVFGPSEKIVTKLKHELSNMKGILDEKPGKVADRINIDILRAALKEVISEPREQMEEVTAEVKNQDQPQQRPQQSQLQPRLTEQQPQQVPRPQPQSDPLPLFRDAPPQSQQMQEQKLPQPPGLGSRPPAAPPQNPAPIAKSLAVCLSELKDLEHINNKTPNEKTTLFFTRLDQLLKHSELRREDVLQLFNLLKDRGGIFSFLHHKENPCWDWFRLFFKTNRKGLQEAYFWHTEPYQRAVKQLKVKYRTLPPLVDQRKTEDEITLIDYVRGNSLYHRKETETRKNWTP